MLYNWNVIGHETQLIYLENELQTGRLHHAYLFVGPESIGKYRVAKTLASILQCENNFCGTCNTCIQVEKKSHPDTIELEDDGESIKIATVRDVITRLSMTTPNKHKIVLIENCGRFTEEAGNCFLKTLEEPSAKTLFIFTAYHIKEIMPTIISRMRVITFKKTPPNVLETTLQKRYPEVQSHMLKQVIALSLGRSGRAIKLLSQQEMFDEVKQLYQEVELMYTQTTVAMRLHRMGKLVQDPGRLRLFLSLLIHYLRNQMYSAQNFVIREAILKIIEKAHRVLILLEKNVNPRLLLEDLMLSFPSHA